MHIASPSFQHNGRLPKEHTGFGEDHSPALYIEDIPKGTVSLAIIMDDLDVPFFSIFTHWIIWNIPAVDIIPSSLPGGAVIETPIPAIQGLAWGKHIYRGPKQPPFIRKAHRYRFTVYALDQLLDLSPDSHRAHLIEAMGNHVIEQAEIIGIYNPIR